MSNLPTTMMALRAHRRGGPEQFRYEEAPVPAVGPGEALVKVAAAGITPAELGWDATWVDEQGGDRTPTIPSHEVSGTVVDAAPDADVIVGSEVYALVGFHRNGSAAQYVAVPAADLAAKPAGLDHIETAALPLSALTAWQALVDHARVEPGEDVLIRGAAGGVGLFAVQVARLIGAHPVAVTSADTAALVRSLGASGVILRSERPPDQIRFDVILDAAGGPFPAELYSRLQPGGRLVTLSEPAKDAEKHGVQATFFVVEPSRVQLTLLAGLADEKKLKSIIAQVIPLADGGDAYASGSSNGRPGKTVLTVD
jgi:NADPH:quinone reductase-like Zn-dependent oxidoreductase